MTIAQRSTVFRIRLVASIGFLVGGSWVASAQQGHAPLAPPSFLSTTLLSESISPLSRRDLIVETSQSCASASCHGGPRPGIAQATARRGNEYQLWVENDPHAQSWRTICNEKSEQLMRSLHIIDDKGIVTDKKGYDNCLACHNTTQRFNETRTQSLTALKNSSIPDQCGEACDTPELDRLSSVNSFTREGVGCAACHGPGDRWISTHFVADWTPSTEEGFVNNNNLYVRARMCASCHVGDVDRDMNHDIIAAGHPPLRYELATYHSWLPKHWRDHEANDKTYFEAQLWLAGQFAAADASLALLESRAKKSHTVSVWPELASYDCASCHHQLGLDNSPSQLMMGRGAHATYSQWNDSGLRWLIAERQQRGTASIEDIELLESLDRVRNAMEWRSVPDCQDASNAAINARSALDRWLRSASAHEIRHQFRSDDLARLVATVAGSSATFETWEQSVQWYLAAVAARESWPGGWTGPLADPAKHLRDGLRYPEAIDSSRFATKRLGSTMNRDQVRYHSVELARWLGAIGIDYETFANNDQAKVKKHERELRLLIDELRELYKQQDQDFQDQVKKLVEKRLTKVDEGKGKPKMKPMTDSELFNLLENKFSDQFPSVPSDDNDEVRDKE